MDGFADPDPAHAARLLRDEAEAVLYFEGLTLVPRRVACQATDEMLSQLRREEVSVDMTGFWVRGAGGHLRNRAAMHPAGLMRRVLKCCAQDIPEWNVRDPLPDLVDTRAESGFLLDGRLAEHVQSAWNYIDASHGRLADLEVKATAEAFARVLTRGHYTETLVLRTNQPWAPFFNGVLLHQTMLVLDCKRESLTMLRLMQTD